MWMIGKETRMFAYVKREDYLASYSELKSGEWKSVDGDIFYA